MSSLVLDWGLTTYLCPHELVKTVNLITGTKAANIFTYYYLAHIVRPGLKVVGISKYGVFIFAQFLNVKEFHQILGTGIVRQIE